MGRIKRKVQVRATELKAAALIEQEWLPPIALLRSEELELAVNLEAERWVGMLPN